MKKRILRNHEGSTENGIKIIPLIKNVDFRIKEQFPEYFKSMQSGLI
jgi:hypothetical protein